MQNFNNICMFLRMYKKFKFSNRNAGIRIRLELFQLIIGISLFQADNFNICLL